MKQKETKERKALLDDLLNANGLRFEDLAVPRMLNWNDLSLLVRHPLVEIGAHTLSHPVLPKIGPVSAWREIRASKRIIERKLKNRVSCFAYPYGANSCLIRLMARCAGFDYGFATETGCGAPMAIPRINAVSWT